MSAARRATALAEVLTARLAALDVVVALFPPPTAIGLPLRPVSDRVVEVRTHGDVLDVRARLATSRDVALSDVVRRVREVVLEAVGDQRYALHIEIALIE